MTNNSSNPCYKLARALQRFRELPDESQAACIEALKGTEYFVVHATAEERDVLHQLLSACLTTGVGSKLLDAQLKGSVK